MGIRFEHMTSEEWLKDKKLRDSAHEESVTSMYNCTHGPKRDCHACLVGEMAEVLEEAVGLNTSRSWREWLPNARTVLEKANLIEDCIPSDEAEEASRT